MKLISKFFLALLIFSAVPVSSLSAKTPMPTATPSASPSASATPTPVSQVNSFEMFWPIAPGKTKGDALYPVKIFKENLRAAITFSPYRKADFYITISEKRVVEAESLFNSQKSENATKTLDMAASAWEKSVVNIEKSTAAGQDTAPLKSRLSTSFDNQTLLFNYLILKHPDQQSVLTSKINKIGELRSRL
jgi:hypothetical protein